MKNKLLLLLITLLCIYSTASAQTWLWGREGTGSLKADLSGSCIATNKTGNVYATGSYETSITFGTTTLNSSASTDLFLVKYDQDGNVVWANTSENNANGKVSGTAVASDDSDNAYVTGFGLNFFQGADTVSFGTDTLDLPISYSFLVKYNTNGKVVWAKQPSTGVIPVFSVSSAVATDKFGHEYVTGGNSAPYLIKYDRNGNTVWTVQEIVGSSGFDFASGYSVATDVFGNVYVAGYFTDSLYLGTNKLFSANQGIFLAKYDSNGNVLWTQQSNNNHFSNYIPGAPAVTTDPSGAAYLTCEFSDSITFGSYNFSSSDSNEFVIVKYNPGGSISWAKQSVTANVVSWDSYSISADDSNHIYVSGGEDPNGSFNNNCSFVFSNDTVSINDTVTHDLPVFLLKFDSSGKVLCTSTLSATGKKTNGITADPTGEFIYMGGTFDGSVSIGNDDLTDNTGGFDTYIARWQSCHTCDLLVNVTPKSVTVCNGVGVTLRVPIAAGLHYTWSPSAGLNATTGDSVVANPTITTTYTVTGTDTFGCIAIDTDVIIVGQGPNKPIITESATGDTLFSSAKNGNQWFFDDTLIHGATDSFFVIAGRPNGWYYVEVTNQANGCSTTSDSTTGINQLSIISNQLLIYPNPTNSSVFIKINSSAEHVSEWSLQFNNVLGQTRYSISSLNYENEIDLSAIPEGIYFITIINKTGRAVVPVVKE